MLQYIKKVLLQLMTGKVLRPFHCVEVECSKFRAGSIYFTSKLAIADVEKRSIQKTRPNSLYRIQYAAIYDRYPVNNGDKTVHQQAAPPTRFIHFDRFGVSLKQQQLKVSVFSLHK